MDVTHPKVLSKLVLVSLLLSVGTARQALAESKPDNSRPILPSATDDSSKIHLATAPAPVRLSAKANVRQQTFLFPRSQAEQEEQVEQQASIFPTSKKKPVTLLGEELILRPATSQAQTETQAVQEHPSIGNQQPLGHSQTLATSQGTRAKTQVEDQPDPVADRLVHAHTLSQQADTLDEFSEVVRLCRQAILLGVESERLQFTKDFASWALNHRGQLYSDDEQGNRALADYEASCRLSTDNWRALHNRAVSRAHASEYAEAFDDFNRVIKLNPEFAKAYCNRATLYMQANAAVAALDDFTQATQLEPDLIDAQIGRGRTCHMLGMLDEALESFTAAVRLQPDNANILCSRADLLADMGQYDQALQDYANAIELDPKFGHAYRNGAWLLATCPDDRVRDVTNALLGAQRTMENQYGQQHVALDTLAAAQANAGQFDEAVPTISRAIELAPQSTRPLYRERLALYQQRLPFRIEPLKNVSQADYQSSDE